MLKIIVPALLLSLVVLAACTAWQRSHDESQDQAELDFVMADTDDLIADMRAGRVHEDKEYVRKPAPLPARQPWLTALVTGVGILGIARILIFMHRMETDRQ